MTIPLSIPGIEVQVLHSTILNRDLQLFVKLPWSYEHSNKAYAVLYTTDANRSFFTYSSTSLIFETPGSDTPEIIIVGIGYRLDVERIKGLVQWASWRTRDLTPTSRPEVDQWWEQRLSPLLEGEPVEVRSGGAQDFLTAITEEIIPFIEGHYHISPGDSGLAGYSYGGLFTLYTLFHAPELFQRYFAGSPSIWQQLFTDEEKYATIHSDLEAKLFISAGERETDLIEKFTLLIEKLESRHYPGLDLQTQLFSGEGHASAYAAAVSRALCVLYNPDWHNL
jgi:predicted alpha/beta superfamily hydrolase